MSTEIIYNTYDNEASIVHDDIVNDKVLKVATSSFGNSTTKDVLEYPLAENLLEVQSYGFSQFIKTSFLVRKAEVILNIDDEDIVVAEAENIEMNHWYRLEGFFTMDELKKVDFNNATLRLRITKAFNDPEVYIYRPCLTKGDTIPDWFPSLEEIVTPEMGLSEVLANGNTVLGGQHIKFLLEGLPDAPPIYWENNGDLNITVGTTKDGTAFIATNSEFNNFISEEGDFITSDEREYNKSIYSSVIIGRNSARSIAKSLSGSTLVGLDTGLKAIGGLGGDTLIGSMAGSGFNYIAPALQDYRLNGTFQDGSHNTFNVIVGRSGGLKYKEGAGNVLIGHNTSDERDNKYGEIWETLIIHGDKRYSYGAQLHFRNAGSQREAMRPLIVGKFDEKWFEVNGKLKLRPYYNVLKKEGDAITLANKEVSKWQTKVDQLTARLLVLEQRKIENENTNLSSYHDSAYDRGVKYLQEANSELTRAQNFANQEEVPNFRENGILIVDTTDLGEVVVAKKTDFILDVIMNMTPEQLTQLITKLPIEEKEVVTYNASSPRPATGEEGKLYVDTDEDKGYLWDKETQSYVGIGVVDLSNYYNKQEVDGLLDEKLNIGDGGELKKIGDGYGLQDQIDNPDNYGTLGENAVNLSYSASTGDFGATGVYSYAEGFLTTASGDYSHAEGLVTKASGDASHAEGADTTASGNNSHAEGAVTIAGSYAESARGVYNEVITPISATEFKLNDVIESVGVGTGTGARKNALTRWKNGAFKWLLQPLSNITNAVIGFHAADENGRLNYHNGTEWKKYALEDEVGEDVDLSNYIEKLESSDVEGQYILLADGTRIDPQTLVTEKEVVTYDASNPRPATGEEGKLYIDTDTDKAYLWDEATQDYIGIGVIDLSNYYNKQEVNGLLAGKADDNHVHNGVTPTVTASVVTSYDIDVATQTEHWNLTMTGDTDFDFANMFASGHSKVITITLEGDYAFTFPSWLKSLKSSDVYDTNQGILSAEIVINIKDGGANPRGYYTLQMIDYAS